MEYLVNNTGSFEKLKTDKNLKHSIRKIRLALDDNIKWRQIERKLNKYYFACGCQEGAIGVYLSIVFCFMAWWVSGFAAINGWWKVIVVVAASSLIGKISGLLISRYRLKKVLRVLENHFVNNPY